MSGFYSRMTVYIEQMTQMLALKVYTMDFTRRLPLNDLTLI